MSKELPKNYDPKKVEDQIYAAWEKSGYFNPDNLKLSKNAKPYTIVLPPPNITDKLHLGHSVMLAIQDLLIRYHRMQGYRALWIPGTDHAAIATQNVVEKKLFLEDKKTRHELGKKKFLDKVWEFATGKQSTILHQTKKMGSSLDWSRIAFTLDEKRKKAVSKMFVDMYNAGAIYRGERIVNWCPRCQTTLADDEVEYEEKKGKIYTFKYHPDFPFSIATTRPETKLGDTAVAVNPKDKRYKKHIGKTFEIDFIGVPLKLKIIADRNIDIDFGTGAVGVTPAHSMIDWKMAEKNNLEIKKVIDENGNIQKNYGEYSGNNVASARTLIISNLKKAGLLEKEEEVNNNLSVCYRCDTPIEPLPSKQWFIAVDKKLEKLGGKSLKEKSIEVTKKNKIQFIPERFTKIYLDWMENLHDWCISRQIWFGHEIPAWFKGDALYVGIDPPKNTGWKKDPDSLDTWFSSGMWTFSTLGWPDTFKNNEKSGDLKKFHPTQVLETGYEILTLWVSRMIMMSLFAIGEIPFEKVYLHGMVLDKQGKKMSKSKGNGIDPLDEIAKYGTDAVRLSLLIGNTPGNDMKLYDEKIAKYRNFTNKIWNISRYIIQKTGSSTESKNIIGKLLPSDLWILKKMKKLISEVTNDLDNLRFSQAGEKLHDFTWNDFADWYLEVSKFESNEETKNSILIMILKNLLKLWHPFMPYITEHIWSQAGETDLLMVENWPNPENYSKITDSSKKNSTNFELIIEIISAIRNARAENKIDSKKQITIIIDTKNTATDTHELIHKHQDMIKKMRTGIGKMELKNDGTKTDNSIHRTTSGINIYIPIEGLLDIKKEKLKREKEINELEKYITGLKNRLKNKSFMEKAPEKIINQQKESLKSAETKLALIKKHLQKLS